MDHSVLLVIDLNEFAESTAVVVVSGFSVAKGLEYGPSAENGLLHAAAVRALLTQRRQVVQQEIRRLGFTRATLAAYHDALISLLLKKKQ